MKVWVIYVGYAGHCFKNMALKDEWKFGLFMLWMKVWVIYVGYAGYCLKKRGLKRWMKVWVIYVGYEGYCFKMMALKDKSTFGLFMLDL